MKKIISMITLVAMVVTMCSVSVFADYASTLTISSDATDNKANVGDEIIVNVSVGTTSGMKALGFKIAFDPQDFELGMSESAKGYLPDYDGESYPTFDDFLINEGDGCASYVDADYFGAYSSMMAKYKVGDPTIVREDKNGKIYITFGYAKNTAISASNGKSDLTMGGIVLKVKASDAKQANITIEEATAAGSDGVDTPSTIANTLTLDLNGYTAGGGSTVTATAADTNETVGVTAYTIANDAEIDGAAKKVITKTFDTIEINDATRVYVTIGGVERVFGSDLVSATSGLTVGKLTFGIIVDKNVDLTTVSDFRFE